MGIFDLFKGKAKDKEAPSWSLQRKIKKALNKYIQPQERQAAIRALVDDSSVPAIEALIKRLTIYVEPLTTDETEKNYIMNILAEKGREIIPLLVNSIKTSDSVTWQLNVLREIVSEDEFIKMMLELIEGFDTEYEKNPQRKIQIIETLGEWQSEKIAEALRKFLDDVDETVRYQAVQSLLTQDPQIMRDWLLDVAIKDVSNRIKDLIIDGFRQRAISIKGFHARKQFEEKLPPQVFVDSKGIIKNKGPKRR